MLDDTVKPLPSELNDRLTKQKSSSKIVPKNTYKSKINNSSSTHGIVNTSQLNEGAANRLNFLLSAADEKTQQN